MGDLPDYTQAMAPTLDVLLSGADSFPLTGLLQTIWQGDVSTLQSIGVSMFETTYPVHLSVIPLGPDGISPIGTTWTFDVPAMTPFRYEWPVISDTAKVTVQGHNGDSIFIPYIYGLRREVPAPRFQLCSDGYLWSITNYALGAAATQSWQLPPYCGPAQLNIDNASPGAANLFMGGLLNYTWQGTLVGTQRSVSDGKGTNSLQMQLAVPPLSNQVTLTNMGAGTFAYYGMLVPLA